MVQKDKKKNTNLYRRQGRLFMIKILFLIAEYYLFVIKKIAKLELEGHCEGICMSKVVMPGK